MIIGKWNKSVIMTYIGMSFSILGIYFSFNKNILYALSCLIVAGLCDLVDGAIARKCKRDESEKQFGIELDSLVDVISFIAFPIVIYINMGLNNWYYIPLYMIYSISGICRLAYFNISLEEDNKDIPVKYYTGLPVTFAALLIPIVYLISYLIPSNIHNIYFTLVLLVISILFILNIKIKKPSLKIYPLFFILAIIVLILFLVVL